MASYPGAVKTFATRNNGDTIQAAHMNDVQDEIAAIEDGLLNGTARLNSSAITAVSLNVTGGSTVVNLNVTGTLTASGFSGSGSTFATLNISGGSTLGTLNVTGGSTLATLSAGASTHTSLSVSGGSTLGTVQAGASTLASLSIAGGSTLGTVQAGASTVTSLQVGAGSTFSGAVQFAGMQSTSLSTGNTNNFGLDSTASILLLSAPAGGSTLTGISGGVPGRILTVLSTSGNAWVLSFANAGSSADCRIRGGAGVTDISLSSETIQLQYINNRWSLLGKW